MVNALIPAVSGADFGPFIEDVDDRLRDAIRRRNSCQMNPLDKGTFF
jgi:hypothetical protein